MAIRLFLDILVPLVLLLCTLIVVNGALPPKTFDVVKYGAIAHGKTDNTGAFLKAWEDACEYNGRSRIWIPVGTFLLGSVTFAGPCKGSMSFIIKGTLKAPTDSQKFFTDTWIGFRYMANLTVKGGGILDGQGHAAWRYNDCRNNSQCKPLPVSMRFDFITDSKLYNLRSINSKNTHFNIFACENLNISYIRIRAPAESPNTDGIRIGGSNKINISHSLIATGDDCISMLFGSRNIDISDVTCGPGHGISIGSLGRSHEDEHVAGISVRNCTFLDSDNGVRIKTWDPSLYSLAYDIIFKDIFMKNARNPIIIDQQYNPSPIFHSRVQPRSAVQIKDVTFKNIWGTSSSKVAVNIQCSGALPCRNVKLIDINLAYGGPGGRAESLCTNVFGSAFGKMIPDGCLEG
ncbi:exopolygalacturonase [Phtheirospermum japonicum]|uniref:Exopolygalacturonase n=1 Tax=Phtheirospermum japonicum TaxID=374723 RepID=A0A830B242_9LAMI|nr:exopolygalacturonase [Phtheirospermum japonicum]